MEQRTDVIMDTVKFDLQDRCGSGTPTLPSLPARATSMSVASEASSIGSGYHSLPSQLRKNSAKLRKIQAKHSDMSSPVHSATSIKSRFSKISHENKRILSWEYVPILTEEQYKKRKEKLLKSSKLKEDLQRYWNIETASQVEKRRRNEMDSDDDAYDTDLDEDIGLELIVDEKTKQIKDDGYFPEYKHTCRKLKVHPNHFFIRHSTDDNMALKHRYLNPGDCAAMSNEIKDNLTFYKIDLQDNGMTNKHVETLADMLLKNHYVSDFCLADNPIGPNGARIVKFVLTNNSHIVKVDLTGTKIGDAGGKCCADIIENNVYLRELYIGRNGIGDGAALEIGKALESNDSLEVLDLSWNCISRHGAPGLALGLKHNFHLQYLNLSSNGIGKEGATPIIEALRSNSSLKTLDLSSNRITDDVVDVVARILPVNKSLRVLKLGYNIMSAEGACRMLKPWTSKLRKIKNPHTFDLEGVDVNSELALLAHKLGDKRGIKVIIKIPPSRREKSMDPLTTSLVTIVKFAEKEGIDLTDFFPRSYEEKGAMISTDDVIELFKHSGKDISKSKIFDLRKIIHESRDRHFELKELLTVLKQITTGKDPYKEDPLRTPLAGERRGIPPETLKRATPKETGVRFHGGEEN